jgi:REP element-mobilizing transposase RayT
MDDPVITRQKFRPRTLRHQAWNYVASGWYYITICTKERTTLFGNVDSNGKMNLNAAGRIVADEWEKIPLLRQNVELDAYCIMPDHIHGIISLENEDAVNPEHLAKKDHWQSGCLGSVINQFKGACTKRIREISPKFAWQRNFNDHIVRNEKDLERIRIYIQQNPEAENFGKGW